MKRKPSWISLQFTCSGSFLVFHVRICIREDLHVEWDAEFYFWSLQHMQLRDTGFLKVSSSHNTNTEFETNYLALINSCCSKVSKIQYLKIILFLCLSLGKSTVFSYLLEVYLLMQCHGSRWDYSSVKKPFAKNLPNCTRIMKYVFWTQ